MKDLPPKPQLGDVAAKSQPGDVSPKAQPLFDLTTRPCPVDLSLNTPATGAIQKQAAKALDAIQKQASGNSKYLKTALPKMPVLLPRKTNTVGGQRR